LRNSTGGGTAKLNNSFAVIVACSLRWAGKTLNDDVSFGNGGNSLKHGASGADIPEDDE